MPDAAKASGFNVEKEINYIELLRCQKMIGADFGQGNSAIEIYPSEISSLIRLFDRLQMQRTSVLLIKFVKKVRLDSKKITIAEL